MTGEIQAAFNAVYADGPSTAPDEPQKTRIRQEVGATIQAQVDSVRSQATNGASPKTAVRAASLTNVTLSSVVNGASFGGVTVATSDRIAVMGQTSGATNGIYVVQAAAAPVRATDADTSAEVFRMSFYVIEGALTGKTYVCSNASEPTLGTTALTFVLSSDTASLNAAISAKADQTALDTETETREEQIASIETSVTDARAIADRTLLTDDALAGATDDGLNPGWYIDPRGVMVSPGMPYFESVDALVNAVWGISDATGYSPLWVGPAEDGYPIFNPWLSEQLRGIGRVPLIAFDGDSRIDQGVDGYRSNAYGIPYWLSFLTGGRFDIRSVLNFGVGGDTSTAVLARAPATIAAMKTAGCRHLVALFSVNDRGSSLGGGATAAVSIANMEAYQKLVTEAGIDLTWVAEMPVGNPEYMVANPSETDATLTAGQRANHCAVRRWILEQPFKNSRVTVADAFGSMVETESSEMHARDGVLKDGKHQSPLGAYLTAKALAPLVERRWAPLPRLTETVVDVYSASNLRGSLLDNSMLTGTGGTISGGASTGTLAAGWSATVSSGLTAVFSKQVIDGSTWQQVVISGTSASANAVVLAATIDPADIALGDVILASTEVHVDAGHSGLRSIAVRTVITNADTSVDSSMAGAGGGLSTDINLELPTGLLHGVAITPPMPLSGTPADARLDLMVTAAAGEPVNATVRWRAPAVNKSLCL